MSKTTRVPPVTNHETSTSSDDESSVEKIKRLHKKRRIEDKYDRTLSSSEEVEREDELFASEIAREQFKKYRTRDPVQKLKMFARAHNIKYDIFRKPNTEGEVVYIASIITSGSGSSDREAMKKAAKNLLDSLTGVKKSPDTSTQD